jgi:hypothetical protein
MGLWAVCLSGVWSGPGIPGGPDNGVTGLRLGCQ